MVDQEDKILNLLLDFIINNFMIGQERAMYRAISGNFPSTNEFKISDLKTDNVGNIIAIFTAKYLNDCYKSVILRDDPYVVKTFDAIMAINNHSIVCLLNFIYYFIQICYKLMDRSLFNTDSLEVYSSRVNYQLGIIRFIIYKSFRGMMDHKCAGAKTSELDPNDPFIKLQN